MEAVSVILMVALAYFLGSLSTAIITCRVMGLPDPRSVGSHNPGATNVYKVAGRKAAAITLVGDLLKGLLPVLIARALSFGAEALALVALAAFLGHLYPIFFGFKGGKGVATAFGVILGLEPWVALAMLVSWSLVFGMFRISSLAALMTALLTPLFFYLLSGTLPYTAMSLLLTLFVVYRHRSNIEKLIEGTEE